MRAALADLAAETGRHAEICVIGAGFAGLAVARDLVRAGRSVVLLEAGGEDWSDASQDIYAGRVVGDAYFPLDATRLRLLGGGSNHWGGWCRPLDASDFAPKPGRPDLAWPITRADLDPHAERAAEILGIPPTPADSLLDAERGIQRIAFVFSRPPVRMWESVGPELDAAALARVVPDANVTLIRTDGARVTGLEVQDYDGLRTEVRADRYVLATGGIENSRLLLWSDAAQNGALLPPGTPIGRYWMEHPHQTLGRGVASVHCDGLNSWASGSFLSLTPERRQAEGILNCGLRLGSLPAEETEELIASLGCVAPELGQRTAAEVAAGRCCGVRLRAAWEQWPVAANRVALSATERDRFGMPRVDLHWRQSAEDIRTVRESALAFAEYLAHHDLGRLRLDRWLLDLAPPVGGETAGNHHMGGTRMATTPAEGVVDRDCRVFGQANLHVAGSSVFPSGGHANPTYTLVQLALRLAAHLAEAG